MTIRDGDIFRWKYKDDKLIVQSTAGAELHTGASISSVLQQNVQASST